MDELVWKAAHKKLIERIDSLEKETENLRRLLKNKSVQDQHDTPYSWPPGAPVNEAFDDDEYFYYGGEDWHGEQDDED